MSNPFIKHSKIVTFLFFSFWIFLFSPNSYSQMVVSAPALETESAIQSQTASLSLAETMNQSVTLSQMSSIQQDMANIFKKTQGVIQGMGVFIRVIQSISQIKDQINNISKFQNLAQSQGINLNQIFYEMQGKFTTCSELANSAAKEDMTPAERINMVMNVAVMLEQIVGTISGIRTNIFSSIRSNFIVTHVQDCLRQAQLTPRTPNFNTK